AQFYSFPRLLATAEAGWTPQSEKNTAEFLQRMGDSGPRLAAQGVNFFPTATVDWAVSAAPTISVSNALRPNPKSKAKANAEVQWRIAAPATDTATVTARVIWGDGESEAIDLAAEATTDIAQMTLNGIYTGESIRRFDTAGDHDALLEVSVDGEVVSSTEIRV